jgi:hypothetical protein
VDGRAGKSVPWAPSNVSGKVAAGEKTVGGVRRFGLKNEHVEGSNSTGLWKFE